jgi:hypothetical protein
MPILMTCVCGRRLQVPEEHAGQLGKCPSCDAVLTLPAVPPPTEPVEVLEPETVEEPRKKKREDREGELSRLYDDEAREQAQREAWRGRGGRRSGKDGWTMFGVHLTAGVLGGTALVLGGLAGLGIYAAVVSSAGRMTPVGAGRLLGAAVAGILFGLFLLIRAVCFGEED